MLKNIISSQTIRTHPGSFGCFFWWGWVGLFFRPPPVRFHKSLNSFLVVVCLSPSSQEYMYENLICPPSQPTSQDNPSSDTWLLYPKRLSAQLRKIRTVYFVRVGCVQIKSLKLPWVMLHHPLPASLIALPPLSVQGEMQSDQRWKT